MKKVIKFYLNFIELCCAYCVFMNLHEGHKILKIEDEELLKKENLTIDGSTNEFNNYIQQLNNLKNLIEKEMSEIDNTYEKVIKKQLNTMN